MSESTWQFLVLLFLFFAVGMLFEIRRTINRLNEGLFGLFSGKATVSENIASLAKEVRELRWTISGGPNDYDDEQPPNRYDETVAYNISKILEDLVAIRSKITGQSSEDEE